MEAAGSTETPVPVNRTTRPRITNTNVNFHCRENTSSHKPWLCTSAEADETTSWNNSTDKL